MPPVQADLDGLIRQYQGRAVTSKTIKYGQGDIAAFFIDWRISDEQLGQGLREWMRENRPTDASPKIRKGKGSSKEQLRKDLKALGAMRLLRKMKWEDAYVRTREILKNESGQPQGLFGSHASAWMRAEKHAKETIRTSCEFFKRLT